MPTQPDPSKWRCSLLLFLATRAEEKGLEEAVAARGLPFERIKKKDSPLGEDDHWLGSIGNEAAVIAMRPARTEDRRLVMGSTIPYSPAKVCVFVWWRDGFGKVKSRVDV